MEDITDSSSPAPGSADPVNIPTSDPTINLATDHMSPRHRTKSRLARYQSTIFVRQTVFLIGLSIAILLIVIWFGIPLLIRLAAALGDVRSKPGADQEIQETATLVPPVLQPMPEATFSATIKLSGFAVEGKKVAIFLNTNPLDDVTTDANGEFSIDLPLRKGENRVWAIMRDGEVESEKSAEMKVTFDDEAPELTVDAPEESAAMDTETVEVRGLVNEEVYLTVNGRLVNQRNDNSFSTTTSLQEGKNSITIYAKDLAGNTATKELKVTYEP